MPPKRARRNHTQPPFVNFKELYTNKCYVDKDVLKENGAGILKASFVNENQEKVIVHVPTTEFFELHTLNQEDKELWDHMNLKGFFELPVWGPNYMRAYQALTTLTQDNFFTVTGLDGEQKRL